jgi:hypothetical protein
MSVLGIKRTRRYRPLCILADRLAEEVDGRRCELLNLSAGCTFVRAFGVGGLRRRRSLLVNHNVPAITADNVAFRH